MKKSEMINRPCVASANGDWHPIEGVIESIGAHKIVTVRYHVATRRDGRRIFSKEGFVGRFSRGQVKIV